jgi:hypothetical protein
MEKNLLNQCMRANKADLHAASVHLNAAALSGYNFCIQESQKRIKGWVQMSGTYNAGAILERYDDKGDQKVTDDTLVLVGVKWDMKY